MTVPVFKECTFTQHTHTGCFVVTMQFSIIKLGTVGIVWRAFDSVPVE